MHFIVVRRVAFRLVSSVAVTLAVVLTIGCLAHKTALAPQAAPAPPPPPKVTLRGAEMKSATQIDVPGGIDFMKGHAKIVAGGKSKKALTQIAQVLKDNPEITKLRIEVHADNVGETKGLDNDKLSKERAQAVADWLVKNGTEASRLVAVGTGSKHPLATNDTPEHKAGNKRTEFHVEEFNGKPIAVAAEEQPTAVSAPADAGVPDNAAVATGK
jgi:outer membrane protein OmpA-like peptidoglycan-associated protein